MPQASGTYKQVSYKVANTAGAAASGAGGKLLRRVQSMLDLQKEKYESGEVRSDFQRADLRHGVRRSTVKHSGELSPGTFADFLAAALKRDFTAVAAITGLTVTIAGSGPTYTVTRSAGDWLAGGMKRGFGFRLSGGILNVANSAKNLIITNATALVLTVVVLNGSSLVAEGPIVSVSATVVGKVTFTPQTGHVEKFFTIENWYPEVPASEVGFDLRLSQLALSLPASGLATLSFDLMGKDVIDDTVQRFTSPTAASTTGLTAAVNGVMLFQGAAVAVVTSAAFTVACNYTGDPVVGSNVIPQLVPGRVIVSGSCTVKYIDTAWRAAFRDETEVDLVFALSSDNSATSEFMSFILSRIKFSDASKSDGETEIVQTIPFDALLARAGGAGTQTELTTLMVQDSAAP